MVSVNLGCSFSFFSDLFNQDRNKDEFEAAHLIVKEWGGVESIAKGLETDLAVSNPLTLSFLSQLFAFFYRMELSVQKTISNAAKESNDYIIRIYLLTQCFRFGDNKRMPRKIKTVWELFLDCFEDFILKVLMAAAAVSLILGIINEGWAKGWIEGVSIFIAIAIIVSVTTTNNYIKEKQFQELQNKQDVTSARVIRDGKILTVDAEELVVGDLVTIPAGDNIPADCIAYKTTSFSANESSLTGETNEQHKAAVSTEMMMGDPLLLQNTLA